MGKWKCMWRSKVLEGESFMDLIAVSSKEEGVQHVYEWENVSLVKRLLLLLLTLSLSKMN
jgi:hypothetical protein